MAFERIQRMPDADTIIQCAPLRTDLQALKQARDKELQDVITGQSDKFLVIIGPCSADDEKAVLDYVTRLAQVNQEVQDKLFLVPRIYTNKPRTTGEGYKGMLHQPNPTGEPNLSEGILAIRHIHMKVIAETGFTTADEMLYPDNLVYCEDILSYIAIGARSVENQQHRLTCSGIDIPVGMKNPTSGDLTVMYNAIQAAQGSHTFIYGGHEVKTDGNPLAHAVLRGSVNRHGEDSANYHYEDLLRAVELYAKRGLENPTIVVDTNHSNSAKRYNEQPRIAKEILYSRRHNADVARAVRGLMVESYLEEGRQEVGGSVYGKSITDPCLGWEATRELLLTIAGLL